MSNNFKPFGSGAGGFVNYKIFKEVQKGEHGPSSNNGCLGSVIIMLTVVIIIAAIIIH